MRLKLQKFGAILTSRPAGREAWLSTRAYFLDEKKAGEKIEVDFSGVDVLSPSWADEFISPLISAYPGKVVLLPAGNPTVKASLEFIIKN